jgi:hypothetical protein
MEEQVALILAVTGGVLNYTSRHSTPVLPPLKARWNYSKRSLYSVTGVEVILRPAVRRPVSLCIGHTTRTHGQILITIGHMRCSLYGAPWALPAPSLSGPSLSEHLAISHCLIWDWAPFLSLSYGSQSYGAGILTLLGGSCSNSYVCDLPWEQQCLSLRYYDVWLL